MDDIVQLQIQKHAVPSLFQLTHDGRAFCIVKLHSDLHIRSTLPEFFKVFMAPVVLEPGGADPRTIDEYSTSLALWSELTDNPPLFGIDDRTCAQFVSGLRTRQRLGTKP